MEQFIQQNAVAPEKIENRDFQKLDSTKAISDSLILTMQQRKNDLFKSAIDYPVSTSGGILYFVGMRFTYEGDTLRHTFYINESFDNIVAFK
ncbi:MAG: hypothetical protein K6E67_00010 [Prevotella sp.]|nr:hypothetical protein [Prevotella sp.]